jgi:hypothetical protein
MLNPASSFPFFFLSATITLFLLFGTAFFFITFDLRKIKREKKQEQQLVWYQRPMMLLGAYEILWGLMIMMQTNIIAFSLPHFLLNVLFIVEALFVPLLFISVAVTLIITMRSADWQSVLKPKASITNPSDVPSIVISSELVNTGTALLGSIFVLVFISLLLGLNQPTQLLSRAQGLPYYISNGGLLLVLGISLICLMVLVTKANVRLYTLLGIELRRAALVAEGGSRSTSITIEQASQEPACLSVPTITLCLKKTPISLWLAVILGFMAPLLILGVPFFTTPVPGYLVWLGLFFMSQLVFALKNYKAVQVTNDSLKTEKRKNFAKKEKHITCEEAHLFACYKLPSLFLGRKTIVYYELSSPSKIITWTWVLDPQSPLTIWKPQLPIDEYHRQMQALCDLVSARTGLPLHDLSQT